MARFCLNRKGVTLVELVVTLTILSLLAALILPSTRLAAKRTKEIELRRNLRAIRTAIDDYKRTYDDLAREKKILEVVNETGYPKELTTLVEGHDFNQIDKAKKKFLRRIPADPFNPPKPGETPKWGLRSSKDAPDSSTWGEEDVFDVYSLSEEKAIDGSKYKDW